MFELAKARVEEFIEEEQLLFPQAYAIFAKLKLIPASGASTSASELVEVLSSDDEKPGSRSSDGGSEGDEAGTGDDEEAVDPLLLLHCRLRLRPTHNSCIAGGFQDNIRCAQMEAGSRGTIEIRQSRIDDGGLGVFATKPISRGEVLMPYWGELYATTPETVGRLVGQLKTERMVQTRKHITDSGHKQM